MKTHRSALCAAVLFLVAAACSSSSSSTPPGTGEPGTPTQQTVGTSGGTVTSSDGALTVTVPPGAVSGDVAITIAQIQSPAPGAIGVTYEIGPTGTQFAMPVTLAFSYAGVDLGDNDPSLLEVATVTAGAWTPITDDTVDTTAQIARGTTMHLSPYGIIGRGKGHDDAGVDGSNTTDATTSDDSSDDTGVDATTDAGASDAPFDATGCMYQLSNIGTCANHSVQVCANSGGRVFEDCVDMAQGFTYYCCPPGG